MSLAKPDAAALAAHICATLSVFHHADDSLPFPPGGLPAVPPANGCAVLGYAIVQELVHDCYGPDGHLKSTGDPGYFQAVRGRLGMAPLPEGWMFVERHAFVLYALVLGRAILLEEAAHAVGYPRALASHTDKLRLTEIDV